MTTRVRWLLVAAALALTIVACERVVVLTPGFDAGFHFDSGADSEPLDSAPLDTGIQLDGGTPFPDASFPDA